MILLSKYIEDENGVKYAPVTTPNAVRWPDGSNLNDKLETVSVVTQSSGTTLTAAFKTYYRFDYDVGTLTVTLPSVSGVTGLQGCIFAFTTDTTPNVTFVGNNSETIEYQSGYEIEASTQYEINLIYNGSKWILTYATIG